MPVCESSIPYPPDVLWLNVSPRFIALSYPLLRCLDESRHAIACWEYAQGQDEPNSLEAAVDALHQYLQTLPGPVHAIGHSTAGLIGLLYARRHPQYVKSLTLLSVGVQPALDWQAHYYTRLNVLPCSRRFVLGQMVRELFGRQQGNACRMLETILQDDLDYSPSPHSMWKVAAVEEGGCNMPLFVAGSQDDTVVTPDSIRRWESWFKPGDRLWECPGGRYFFHRFYPELLRDQLLRFWTEVELGVETTTYGSLCDRVL
ncbi:alpha/beta fold hydrolase [Synechococcus sp. PCC 7336]|uniref:alpha/beta fold hydrolase n=1 Tax=Synechococcus sp. PCC 7336 TaxID=195250 RepID=UPI0003492F2D|nr:alpha/beta hydrolase [Synechococcus sp. PCC 7336]